jgi:hypothetical protein
MRHRRSGSDIESNDPIVAYGPMVLLAPFTFAALLAACAVASFLEVRTRGAMSDGAEACLGLLFGGVPVWILYLWVDLRVLPWLARRRGPGAPDVPESELVRIASFRRFQAGACGILTLSALIFAFYATHDRTVWRQLTGWMEGPNESSYMAGMIAVTTVFGLSLLLAAHRVWSCPKCGLPWKWSGFPPNCPEMCPSCRFRPNP